MAVSMGSSAGIGVMTADEAHAVMVALRSRLLEVGLEELDIPGSYDASEEGSSSQIPDGPITTSTNLYSERMHFAFTDSLQSQHPLVISFRMVLGPFFSVSSSGGFATNPRYMAEIRISKGVDDDGSPLGATFISRLASASSNASSYALSNSSGSGDFVRYTGDSLTVFIGLDQVTNTAGKRSLVQIHVERIEGGSFPLSLRVYQERLLSFHKSTTAMEVQYQVVPTFRLGPEECLAIMNPERL